MLLQYFLWVLMGEGNQIRFWWENTIHMSKGVLRRERDVEENVRSAAALGLQDHMNCTQSCVQLLSYMFCLIFWILLMYHSVPLRIDPLDVQICLSSFFYPKYILTQVFLLSFVWKATFSCRWWTVWGWHVGLMLCGQWFQAVSFQAARPLRQGLHLLEGTGNISHTGSAQ